MLLLFSLNATITPSLPNLPNIPNLPRWYYRGRPKTRPVIV